MTQTLRQAGCEKLPPALREQCEKKQKGGDKDEDEKGEEKKAGLALRVVSRFQRRDSLVERVAARYRTARSWDFKPLFTGDKIRVSWSDHPGNQLVIEELPSKPVKRKVRRYLVNTGWYVQAVHEGGSAFLMANILQDAKLSKGMAYEAAVSAMDKALDMAKDAAQKDDSKGYYDDAWFKKTGWPGGAAHESEVSYLEVEPHDYAPIQFKGKDFAGSSEWNSFQFSADRDDDEYMRQTEGMSAFYKSKSAGGARKLFKLLKADPTAVKGMTIDQFTGLLAKNKIAYDYVPTVWR